MTPIASVMLRDLNTTGKAPAGLRLNFIPKYSISSINSSSVIGILTVDCCACGAKLALMESDTKSTPLPVQQKYCVHNLVGCDFNLAVWRIF